MGCSEVRLRPPHDKAREFQDSWMCSGRNPRVDQGVGRVMRAGSVDDGRSADKRVREGHRGSEGRASRENSCRWRIAGEVCEHGGTDRSHGPDEEDDGRAEAEQRSRPCLVPAHFSSWLRRLS